ncbi:4-(cytidine 5'-diphospho)-2-C-methyl-D-erythritol kinase [Leucobacter sp. CSA1]|uniref:4-diphosphocytidyl-2-C-methyl-D-erythritol kinase n=1 Tax=Leucobacter chromiisoli TaxID=2796471 RepID=A0A934Q6V7_9MICO|nr:4-(cytidine 5'-diphospho)-2-C-methyl-D-erythritol kinase [Leucobacter chromiisoli]MBK0418465.1 4-(cytidine 5'-diphospho)-2-C-methyl-D-erythritol kinase [Leucobacter chromiisoli]
MGTTLPGSVTVRAPGKINVFFRVGALQDDGYHDVASLYQAVSLYEEVTAVAADDFSVRFTGPIDSGALPVDDSNLAMRAARLLAEETGHRGGVALTILKRVPIAGGMGGGSADAAATLLACDELWGTGLGRNGLLPLAARLGADVPFALEGGTAVGTGRGDELSPALAKGTFHWVLALSDGGLSTPVVYRALDQHRDDHAGDLGPQPDLVKVDTAVLQAVRIGDAESLAEAMHNDLQAAALRLAPDLTRLLELGESRGALAGIVSGSGPTVAFLVGDAQEAAELRSVLGRAGVRSLTATGPVPGARILDAG